MDVRDLPSRDYHDLVNAISLGPFLPGVVSFRVEWASSSDKRHLHDEVSGFDANVVLTSAQAWWRGETSEALYVADNISTRRASSPRSATSETVSTSRTAR